MANKLKIKAGSGKVGQDKISDVTVVMPSCARTHVHTYTRTYLVGPLVLRLRLSLCLQVHNRKSCDQNHNRQGIEG